MQDIEYALMARKNNEQLEIVLPYEYVKLITKMINLRKDNDTGMYAMDSIESISNRYQIDI